MDAKILHMWPVVFHNEFLCMRVLFYRKTKLLFASSCTSAKSIIRVLGIFSLCIHMCVPSNFSLVCVRASSVPSKCVGSFVCLHVWVCNMSTAGLLTWSLPKGHFNFRSVYLSLIYPSILFRTSAASSSPHSLILSPSLPLSITAGLMRLTSVSFLS